MAKRCTCCLEWKKNSEFYRDRTKADGLRSHCKACNNRSRQDHRVRVKAREQATLKRTYLHVWQHKPRPPMRARRSAGFYRWMRKNEARRRAHVAAFLKRWHTANPAASERWYDDHPETAAALRNTRRADWAGAAVNDLSPHEWHWLVEQYDHCCAYCGQHSDHLTLDHVIPLSQGGHHTLSNVVPACPTCNARKGAHTPAGSGMRFNVRVNIENRLQQTAFL